MLKNGVYAIGYYDSEKKIRLYPDTHLFVLNSTLKAAYAMTVFAGKLHDDNILLVYLGYLDDDLNFFHRQDRLEPIVTFNNIVDFLNGLSENDFVSAGISYKSFLNHYNVIISHINTFRASLTVPEKGVSDE